MKFAYVGLYDVSAHVDKLNIRLQDILDEIGDHPSERPDLVIEYNKLCRIVETFNNSCDDLGF